MRKSKMCVWYQVFSSKQPKLQVRWSATMTILGYVCYELQLKRISNRNRIKTKIAYYQRIIFMGNAFRSHTSRACVGARKPGHSSWLVMIRPTSQPPDRTVRVAKALWCDDGQYVRVLPFHCFWFGFCLYFALIFALQWVYQHSQYFRNVPVYFVFILYPWKLIADRSIY